MPVAKDKVLPILESILKGKSASKTFKDGIATKWAEKIEKEEDIESYINDRSDLLLEAVSEADRRATDATKKAKEDAAKLLNPEQDKEPTPTDDPSMPAWAKTLIDQNKTLTDRLAGIESKSQQQTIAERFKKEVGEGVPEKLLNRFMPTSDQDFETSVSDLKSLLPELKVSGFGNDKPAGYAGGENTGKVKEASKEELDALMTHIPKQH